MSTKLPLLAVFLIPLSAAELIVKVTGYPENQGYVGCALYSSPNGFPTDPAKAISQRHPARRQSLECRFENLKPGDYAVAVSADLNSNNKTDKNFLGMPTEPWGVSRNPRPKMRAPRFEEAVLKIEDGAPTKIEVQLAK